MQARFVQLLAAISVGSLASGALRASETVTYTYDALGRLISTESSGPPNNGLSVSIVYDPTGNRGNYSISGSVANIAPIATDDSAVTTQCEMTSVNVMNNDSDADGNMPLSIVSASYDGALGAVSISGDHIDFTPNYNTGTAIVNYIIMDSRGSTAHGAINILVKYNKYCAHS